MAWRGDHRRQNRLSLLRWLLEGGVDVGVTGEASATVGISQQVDRAFQEKRRD